MLFRSRERGQDCDRDLSLATTGLNSETEILGTTRVRKVARRIVIASEARHSSHEKRAQRKAPERYTSEASGSVKNTEVPRMRLVSNQIWPPCISMILLQMGNPMPVPGALRSRVRRWNTTNTRSR